MQREVSEQERKDAAIKAMFESAKQQNDQLPQDQMEGVDSDEWDD